ncbi:SMEK domain-containing protein [Kordia jejudonensis]|uniref:SMEK domain-containing protein n=1 Tax=Kordia jejudonensis TaxID=1348245 RepID=UPI0006292A71|nr:SMEK domain-containing protein [Kordia jejudonensis]
MNRKDRIDEIVKYSSRFVGEVEAYNKLGKYDINLHAEHFLLPVLNTLFDLELENLNSSKKNNFPAIDLADFKNRVAFQITSTPSSQKITDTLIKFTKYKLNEHFDILYFFILTKRQDKYPDDKLKELIPTSLIFNSTEHIIDNTILLKKINSLSLQKLNHIAKIYKHEFSDIQVEEREKKFSEGYLSHSGEKLFLNLIEIVIPKNIYIADLKIDEESILERINYWRTSKGLKPYKRAKNKESLLVNELKERNMFCNDWLLREGKLHTFKNISDNKEFFSTLIDKGTVTELNCDEFYSDNVDNLRIFKNLLRNTLRQDGHYMGLEWENKKYLLRFRMLDRKNPAPKSIKWKAKNKATKTVISEVINKQEGHVICYKHLAFKPSFELISNKWYLCINSTWSFTNPGGYKTSRYEKDYLSGIKRLENNKTIYYFFRFWCYHLMYKDLFSIDNRTLSYIVPEALFIKTKIDDSKWKPVKEINETTEEGDAVLKADNEIDLRLFE